MALGRRDGAMPSTAMRRLEIAPWETLPPTRPREPPRGGFLAELCFKPFRTIAGSDFAVPATPPLRCLVRGRPAK